MQTVEREVQTDGWLAIKQDALWHPNAMNVCTDVGSETDNHEYKSLVVPSDKTKKPPKHPCKDTNAVLTKVVNHSKEVNAMLNHQSGGTVILVSKTMTTQWRRGWNSTRQISLMSCKLGLVNYCRSSSLQFSHILRPLNRYIDLVTSTGESTGRWRFDICVSPYCSGVVLVSNKDTSAYYRQGDNCEK